MTDYQATRPWRGAGDIRSGEFCSNSRGAGRVPVPWVETGQHHVSVGEGEVSSEENRHMFCM